MKILIIGSKTKYSGSRLIHLKHFSYELEKFNWDVLAKLFVKVVEARLGKNVNTT